MESCAVHENALQDVSMVRSRATIKTESCAGGVHSGYQVELQSAQQVEALQQFLGCSSVGRAGLLQGQGRRFDACHFHHFQCVLSARLDGPPWKWEDGGSNPPTLTKQKSQHLAGFSHYCGGHCSSSRRRSITCPSALPAISPAIPAQSESTAPRVAV